ncbi:MAG TPA: glycosyltransferase family 39 protein [bacterium]|nr:glycosyltransferase family 39 protein [bacterium]
MLKRIFSQNKLLIGILFLGLFLRFLGITHGLPYIFHPDEPTIVRSALGVRFFPNPKHFDWPHLYIYLNYVLYMAFSLFRRILEVVGLKTLGSSVLPIIWTEEAVFYLITRAFTALLGTLTTIPVYLSAKKLFSANYLLSKDMDKQDLSKSWLSRFFNQSVPLKIALFSALAMAVFPFHVHHSHYSLSDVPMAFFVAWVLFFSAHILDSASLKSFLVAGFFVGLSASTKYNGGLSALIVAVAFFLHYLTKKPVLSEILKNSYKPLLSAFMALFGFLLGTPFALFDYKTFSRTDGPKGAYWQFTNVGSRSFFDNITQFLVSFWDKFPSAWSFPFVVLFILGLLLMIRSFFSKKSFLITRLQLKPLIFLYVPSLVFLFYISGFSKTRSHYYMMAYPLIAVIVGWACAQITDFLPKNKSLVLLFFIFIFPFLMSLESAITFARTDTRILASNWYEEFSPPNYFVYYDGTGLDQTLPSFAEKIPKRVSDLKFPLVLVSFCEKVDIKNTPDYFIDDYFRRGDSVCIYKISSREEYKVK